MMHGAIYGVMKTEGALHDKLRVWAMRGIIFFVICAVTLTMATLLYVPHMAERVHNNPWLFSVALANMLAIANIPREFHHGRDWLAFLSSCAAMITLMMLFGLNMYPNLVYSLPDAANSLTIYNASSSPKTLGIMLVIAVHRRAAGHRLHRLHLLDIPRQGEARPDELLGIYDFRWTISDLVHPTVFDGSCIKYLAQRWFLRMLTRFAG